MTNFGKLGMLDLDNFHCQVWAIGCWVAYFIFYVLFAVTGSCKIEKKDKKTGQVKVKSGAALMAFEIVAGFCVTYVAGAGVLGVLEVFDNSYSLTAKDPMYGRSVFLEHHLIIPMIFYQVWNLILCFFITELKDWKMLLHHIATALLAYFGLAPYIQHYAFFFFGVAEISNIFLSFVDVFKYFHHITAAFPLFNMLARGLFALAFYILRIFIWPILSYPFWVSSIDLLRTGKAHSTGVVVYALVANVFLTSLQFLWGYQILGFIRNTFKGAPAPTSPGTATSPGSAFKDSQPKKRSQKAD